MTTPTIKNIGIILEFLGVCILVINAPLLNLPDVNVALTGLLLFIGGGLFLTGFLFSHLPQREENKEKKEE